MPEYNKLIRDLIPQIVAGAGQQAVVHQANDDEFDAAARAKVVEEAREVARAESRETLIEKLADLQEAVAAVTATHHITEVEVGKARREHLEQQGGFTRRLILERTE